MATMAGGVSGEIKEGGEGCVFVGSQSLLQGIFSTQGLNPPLLHCTQIPYHLSQVFFRRDWLTGS